ncbi:MAG: DUF4091 domain-containing protein [Clostridia bacterium]|nr:DUF4091 domain-containing protein [Clostridia bacterium]
MKKTIATLLALLLTFTVIFTSCNQGDGNDDTDFTAGDSTSAETEESGSESEQATESGESNTAESEAGSAEHTTESETEAVAEVEKAYVADFNSVDASKLVNLFSGHNMLNVSVESDGDGEQYARLAATGASGDPYVSFSMTNFVKYSKGERVRATEYPYVMLKVRNEGYSSGTFELYYYAGNVQDAQAGMMVTSSYDVTEEGWQYLLFDLSSANGWEGFVNGFRLDVTTNALAAGEAICIAEIRFLESDKGYYDTLDLNWDAVGTPIDPEAEKEASELLASQKAPSTAFDSYKAEKAENEMSSLHIWFDHLYNRTSQSDNTATDKITYQMKLAKNEAEACQMILASDSDVSGLKVSITDFKNASGSTLETELFWGYYFNVDGQMIVDPLPPVNYTADQTMLDWLNGGNGRGTTIENFQKYDGFDIKSGENQTFVIKVTSTADTPAGEYSATLTVCDSEGKEVKKVTVFAYVWNFTLTEETSCKTLMDMSSYSVYMSYFDFGADLKNEEGHNLSQIYYDFLLKNRVCAYSLPFGNSDGSFSDQRLLGYLNNPRVVAFQTLGWSQALNGTNVSNAYNFLKQNEKWLDKAYFYPVDEPLTIERLDDINGYGELLSENFPGYKLIVPMHVNYNVAGGDFFSYVKDYVTVWCPHTYFYTSFAEWYANRALTYSCSAITEAKLGTFRERMETEQAGGDEVWWYVTRRPDNPEITLNMDSAAVNIRTLFWQQKLYDVDGFLYYSVNHWSNGSDRWYVPSADTFLEGLDAMHEINKSIDLDMYGSGILIYSGVYFAQVEPVASLRLECVRDGIEDFEYLTMLEEEYGKDVVDAIISKWTTGIGEYETDAEAFAALRDKLGALLESVAE